MRFVLAWIARFPGDVVMGTHGSITWFTAPIFCFVIGLERDARSFREAPALSPALLSDLARWSAYDLMASKVIFALISPFSLVRMSVTSCSCSPCPSRLIYQYDSSDQKRPRMLGKAEAFKRERIDMVFHGF